LWSINRLSSDGTPFPFGERSLRRALSEYVEHFHAERNHQGKGNILLFPRHTDIRRERPVQCRDRLGGVWSKYSSQTACPVFQREIPCSLKKIPCYGCKNSLFVCAGNLSASH
jgi:hypothetical protein